MKETIISMHKHYNLDNLTGKLLVASPNFFFSDMFRQSVIYITSSGKDGTIGLIINRPINNLSYSAMMSMIKNNNTNNSTDGSMVVYLGGSTDPERGFILHSNEYDKNILLPCPDNLAISSNIEILKDIALGAGPKNSIFVLGYTNWEEGQLELEMNQNMWLISDFSEEILFQENNETKWNSLLKNLGVESSVYSSRPGYC